MYAVTLFTLQAMDPVLLRSWRYLSRIRKNDRPLMNAMAAKGRKLAVGGNGLAGDQDQRGSQRRAKVQRDPLRNIVRTLLINGYIIDSFERPAVAASMVRLRKRDALGAEARMVILFTQALSRGLQDRLVGDAKRHNSTPIIVSSEALAACGKDGIQQLTLAAFYNILGGEVRTDRVLEPKLRSIMFELGHNRLPPSFSGKPDDLLEAYSEECLEFLLECPVRRYGQERRFEPLPDGLALGRGKYNLYFDAKAYGQEFHPSADDIRRFASYVKDFNIRYSSYVGPLSIFLIIAGSFSTDRNAIAEKINDFYAECGTPMALISSEHLADAVCEVKNALQLRSAINWRRIFVPQLFEMKRLKAELQRIKRDSIVR